MELLKGIFKNFVYRNEDNGYSIAKIEDDQEETQTLAGTFPLCNAGESIEAQGTWIEHSKYGHQFKVQQINILPPQAEEGIIRYLASGIFRGIGPATAEKITDVFGKDTIDILSENPVRIKEIPGMIGRRGEQFVEDWQEHQNSRETMQFLHQFQIPANIGMRIYQKYLAETITTLRKNPYILCEDVRGIGFQKSDEIARKIGFDTNSYFRLQAGLLFTLEQASHEGHIFLPKQKILEKSIQILYTQESENLEERTLFSLDHLIEINKIISQDGFYYLPHLHQAEKGIATWVKGSLPHKNRKRLKDPLHEIECFAEKRNLNFSEEQLEAMLDALKTRIFVLTGGPGTGKTTTLQGMLFLFRQSKLRVKLAAPTGRAARRMAEVCETEAFTLHRVLEYTPGEYPPFLRHEGNQLKCDVLVLDEASMVDAPLFYSLLQALPKTASIIIVGDQDQLPSVGPGNVLRELLKVPTIPHCILNKIFRQNDENDIPHNAHRIQKGLMPEFKNNTQFHFRGYDSVADAQQKIYNLASKNLPEHFGFDPFLDIQILVPMHKGPLGIEELNKGLQARLNPNGKAVMLQGRLFKQGDKVMQLRNNYEKNIFNGDVGIITKIKENSKQIIVDFGEQITIEYSECDQLTLAYACSIHKSQGSEYRAAILILDSSHHIMLQRNLLYTGITRAKERVFLVAQMSAIETAIRNNHMQKRYTQLSEIIDRGSEFLEFLAEPD